MLSVCGEAVTSVLSVSPAGMAELQAAVAQCSQQGRIGVSTPRHSPALHCPPGVCSFVLERKRHFL